MKPTGVILLSDKRSGSTQFERELPWHPEVQHANYCALSRNETHRWLKSAVALDQSARHFAAGRSDRDFRSARALLVDQPQGNLPDFEIPDGDRRLVFEGWEAVCQQFAHPVVFEK